MHNPYGHQRSGSAKLSIVRGVLQSTAAAYVFPPEGEDGDGQWVQSVGGVVRIPGTVPSTWLIASPAGGTIPVGEIVHVTAIDDNKFLALSANVPSVDVDIPYPEAYAGTHTVDIASKATGPALIAPIRVTGYPARRQKLVLWPAIWYSDDTGVSAVQTSNGAGSIDGDKYSIGIADAGNTVTFTDTATDVNGSRASTVSLAIPDDPPAIAADTGQLLHYRADGLTPDGWLSYRDAADDLLLPSYLNTKPQIVPGQSATFTGGESLGMVGARLLHSWTDELHVYMRLTVNELPTGDGIYWMYGEHPDSNRDSFFTIGIRRQAGVCHLNFKAISEGNSALFDVWGGAVPLGDINLEFHGTNLATQGRITGIINGVEQVSGGVNGTSMFATPASGFKSYLGSSGRAYRPNPSVKFSAKEMYATTDGAAGIAAAIFS